MVAGKDAPGEEGVGGGLEAGGSHAEEDAELGKARRELDVEDGEAEVARGGEIRVDGGLEQRGGDAGDGEDGEKGHLEAGVEEAAGTDGEQAEGGESDGVEGVALAVEKTAEQIEGDHPERALDGRGEAGEERVGEGAEDGEECGRDAREAEAAGDPEQAAGDDGEMEAGDDEHMKGAGALEADAERVGEKGAVAGDHGGEHDGVVGREAKGGRQAAHSDGKGQEALGGGVLPTTDAAGERGCGGRADALDAGDADRGGGGEAEVEEVVGAAEDARVMVGFRRKKLDDGADAVATAKGLNGRLCGWVCGPADAEADVAGGWDLGVRGAGDLLDGGDAEIDALGGG